MFTRKLSTITTIVACLVVCALSSASPVTGVRYDVHRVAAFSTNIFHVSFYGGEVGAVLISGDGDTDLDLFVYDEFGNLIGSDTDSSDDCVVEILPRWTGVFRIEVRNLGGIYNQYEIGCI